MTLTAEIGGVALALQLATDVSEMMWIPVAAFAVWVVIWRVKFKVMENVAGLTGLFLIVFAVSVFVLNPNWSHLFHQATAPTIPESESAATYWYFAIALFGAAMTPYEVFFFSSGAVEEHWTIKDLGTSRLNVMVGFPLGGLLSVGVAASAAIVLLPNQIEVTSLSQVVMPVVVAGGKLALAFAIVGIVAATFGAALETTLSGQVLATRIFGGAPPRSRLQEVPWKLVASVGVTVKLAPTDMSFDVQWVERWLRDFIVARIPGGRHAAE
jgi:Mn2+/Fe2+ NRAMP family transporter